MAKRKSKRGNGQGSLFKRTEGGAWIGAFYDHGGQRRTKTTGTTDKGAAQRILNQWVADAALRREGVIDVSTEATAMQARRPIGEHLADFKASLTAKGTGEQQAKAAHNRAKRIMDGCGFKTWGEVSASRVMSFLDALRQDKVERDPKTGEETSRKRGISAQTFNYYLGAAKQFGRWMVKDRRAADNPLAHLQGLNVRTDRRHDRRALTADELRRLIDTTASEGVERQGVPAADRAAVYRVAAETGLRRSELASLTRASFDLNSDPATVTVAAAYSKRRRDDTLPMRPSLAAFLGEHLAGKLPSAPAFHVPGKYRAVEVLKDDLAAAGVAYCEDGKFADFHALRHTFITNLASGGVHPKTAQALARHSTITLTMDRYTHHYAGDDLAALDTLPDLATRPSDQQAKATGTDHATPEQAREHVSNRRSNGSAKRREPARQGATENEPLRLADETSKTRVLSGKSDFMRGDATPNVNAGGGTRTHTSFEGKRILNPSRLPIPPHRQSLGW